MDLIQSQVKIYVKIGEKSKYLGMLMSFFFLWVHFVSPLALFSGK